MSDEPPPQNGGHLGVLAPDGQRYDVLWARRGVAMRGNDGDSGGGPAIGDGVVGMVVGFVVSIVVDIAIWAVWDVFGVRGAERKVAVHRHGRMLRRAVLKTRVADQDAADAWTDRVRREIEAGARPWETVEP